VLALAVSELLFERFSGSDEGDLTRVRAHLVREDSLHRAALTLGLPELLRLSEGEARGGGAQRASILADAVEALIGAVFQDGGYTKARALVQSLFGEVIQATEADSWSKDAKTELQEWLQARRIAVPSYRIAATRGQAHAQTFEVECAVPALDKLARGIGRSRRAAEQEAARRLLAELKAQDASIPRSAAASWPSSAAPTWARARCSMPWLARRSASPAPRRRPRATASPASARWARRSSCSSIRRASRRATVRR
jgi:ribonuclease-3